MQHTLLDIVHLTLWTLDVNLILQPAGMYGVLPYALAQFTIELPYIMFQVVLYSVITYSMIQFEWTAAKFFWCTCLTRTNHVPLQRNQHSHDTLRA